MLPRPGHGNLAVGAAIPVPAARRFTIPEADGLRDRVHGL